MADVVKYGIQIPNRVFVGGVAFDTKEEELKDFFTQYGKIKECKIIKDNQSISRGFAFVTFECRHDAIQTQQLGTVFFNQKKLNLGPAIRQKGVVFNGAAEFDNEPVLSTGVYIHPSGYSYTVAPNGVWYFHNADGSPRPRTPGSPSMTYSPTLVNKIQNRTQEYQAASPTSSNTICQTTSNSIDCEPHVPVSVIHSTEHQDVQYQTQVVQNIPNQPTAYVHAQSTIGSSNIHVAFQNMSISSHPASTAVSGHHLHLAANQSVQTPSPPIPNQQIHMTNPMAPAPVIPMEYTRMGEMVLPCYSTIKYSNNLDGNQMEARTPNVNGPYQYPVNLPKQSYYTMMSNGVRDPYIYPVCDPYRPTFVYPPSSYHTPPVSDSQPCYYKKMYSKQNGSKGRGKYGFNDKDAAMKIEAKCA